MQDVQKQDGLNTSVKPEQPFLFPGTDDDFDDHDNEKTIIKRYKTIHYKPNIRRDICTVILIQIYIGLITELFSCNPNRTRKFVSTCCKQSDSRVLYKFSPLKQ